MRTFGLKALLLIAASALSFGAFARSSFDSDAPVGWATVKSTPTGGGAISSSNYKVVTTESEWKSALESSSVKHVFIKGSVKISNVYNVSVKDKTIYGLPGSELYNPNQKSNNGILVFKSGTNNVIMRNVTFRSAGAYDCDGYDNFCIEGGTNIWVDHCDFQDGVDGNFDIKNGANNISVSWCRFRYLLAPTSGGSGGSADHRYTNLIGSSDSKTTDRGLLNVTFQLCWWDEGCKERMPRVRFGKVHILNCLFSSSVTSYCVGGGKESSVYVENSAFYNITASKGPYSKITSGAAATFTGSYYDSSCKSYSDSKMNSLADGAAFKPSEYYKYPVYDASKIYSEITNQANCGAGATLNVVEGVGVVDEGGSVTPNPEPAVADLSLKSLKINGAEISLDGSDSYSFEVAADVNSCDVEAVASASDASVVVTGSPVTSFPGVVEIAVSHNGETKTYVVNVTRKAEDVKDEQAPALIDQSVANNAEVRKSLSKLVLTYDEAIVADEVSVKINGTEVDGVIVSGTMLNIPLSLDFDSAYDVTVAGVKDASGNEAAEFSLAFTTGSDNGGATATWIVGDAQYWSDGVAEDVALNEAFEYYISDMEGNSEITYTSGVSSKIQESASSEVDVVEGTFDSALNPGGSASSANNRYFTIPVSGPGKLSVVYQMYSATNLATVVITENLWDESNASAYTMTENDTETMVLSYDVETAGETEVYVYAKSKKCYYYAIVWEPKAVTSDCENAAADELVIVSRDGGVDIVSDKACDVLVSAVSGKVVGVKALKEGVNKVDLQSGVYVIGHQKVVVK